MDGRPAHRRRVLILSREYPPAIGPHSIRIAKLAKYLPRSGWDVAVLTTPVDHAWATDESLLNEIAATPVRRVPRLFSRVVHPRAGLDLRPGPELPTPDDWRPPIRGHLARLLVPDSTVLWAIPAAWAGRGVRGSVDALLATGPPFSTHLGGAWLAGRLGIPLIVEYRDNWTTNPLYRRGRVVQALNRRLERTTLDRADAVVVVSEEAADELRRAFPDTEDRIVVAANGFDPDDLPPPATRAAVFEIAYLGSLHLRRDPRPFLAALRGIAADPAASGLVRLRLVGNIPRWVADAAVAALGPDHVMVHGLLPHRDALLLASRAALLLGVTSGAEAGGAALTSKLPEYLGLARPILMLAPPGPAARLVSELGAGLVAPPDDVPAIASALRSLFDDWAAGQQRTPGRDAIASYTRAATADRVAAALDRAVARYPSRPRS